jgi:hypothetical protein
MNSSPLSQRIYREAMLHKCYRCMKHSKGASGCSTTDDKQGNRATPIHSHGGVGGLASGRAARF